MTELWAGKCMHNNQNLRQDKWILCINFRFFFKCLIYTVGEFGRYQWIQYLLHLLPAFTGGVFYQTFKEEIVFERLPQIISLLVWKQSKTCEYFCLFSFWFKAEFICCRKWKWEPRPDTGLLFTFISLSVDLLEKEFPTMGKQKLITHYPSDLSTDVWRWTTLY